MTVTSPSKERIEREDIMDKEIPASVMRTLKSAVTWCDIVVQQYASHPWAVSAVKASMEYMCGCILDELRAAGYNTPKGGALDGARMLIKQAERGCSREV